MVTTLTGPGLTHLHSGDKPPLHHFIDVLQLVLVGHSNLLSPRHEILQDRLSQPGVAHLECHPVVLRVVVQYVHQRIIVELVNILHVLQTDLLACRWKYMFKLIMMIRIMINPPSIML